MFSVDNREKLLLMGVARRSLITAVEKGGPAETLVASSALECAGAFVTLRRRGRLRGCIGQIVANQRAVEIISYAARAAALEDPRFDPVRAEELPEIEIELSLLSPAQAIEPHQIEVGKHGLIVTRGWQRGLLLPQVATEHRWEKLRFLEETCVKAGLERHAWKDSQTRLQAFTALVFSESEISKNIELEAPAS
ncbi:MAG TPA: AmmeMemoRadiSam system protein A [Candidatus Acidoferrum sp.]|jgi:AmmeMemoRadiSam system protein A|nr:AmmeMemoRadiSam system protein A [Candidatus Acidoferrum sp.]